MIFLVLRLAHDQQRIPFYKRARVCVTGDRWNTIIGPPSTLELILSQCPSVKTLPKKELNIHVLQHTVNTSRADLDYIVGNSALMESPLCRNFTIWGMDDPEATYTNWGDLLRAVCSQALSRPLDITQAVGKLNARLGSCSEVDIRLIGPSSHAPYLATALNTAGRSVSVKDDKSLDASQLPAVGRIAIVGMAGSGPGSNDVEDFWNVIMSKQDLCEEIPKDRFDIEEFFCPEKGDKCTTTTRFGCFMNKPGNFDSRFFHISPREALLMDPGHRLFLMST
jgi:hypothetical protein